MSNPLRVLIVEDSEDDAILVLRELKRAGYDVESERVDTPESMQDALDRREWDIVLSDYSMPRFSMPAALAMVKEKGLEIPFIIVSGAIGAEAAVSAMREGAHDYVMKNDLARLVPAVARELREAEVRSERRRVQQALQDSEELYSALVSNISDAVYLVRGDSIAWCNDRVQEIYGYSRDELLGQKASLLYPSDIDPVEFAEKIRPALAAVGEHGIFRGTRRFQKRDGEIAFLEYSISRIPGKRPVEIIAVVRDVTESVRAEEQLRHSEEYYRALTDNAQDVVVVLNADGTVRYHSPSFERVLGFSADEQARTDPFQLVHPDDVAAAAGTLGKLLQAPGASAHAEVRTKASDGTWRTLEIVGQNLVDNPAVGGIVANFRDITERKRAEEALQESELHYRLLAENATDIIATLDFNLSLTYISPSVTHRLGYTAEEAMAHGYEGLLTPAAVEDAVRIVAGELAAENGGQVDLTWSRTMVLELRRKDGSTIWSEVEATLLRDRDGRAIGILLVARDISERKRAEEERGRLEQQLQLAGRLAAVGELAAGVAHELNNPLAAVQAFAQLLHDKDDLESSVRQDVETIYREAKRATKITTNLLRFARRHKPEKQIVSINEILEKSLELHAYKMKVSNIEMVTEFDPNLPPTMADADQMHQVFVNIITNSNQAMTEANGKGRLQVTTQRAGDVIRISFEDTGPGIREENLASIFDPFFTTKEVGKGTGLGLSICYGIIKEHGGQIYARSKGSSGATFVVEIPIVTGDSALPPRSSEVQPQEAANSPSFRN
jgi:PAS domain S-box-containing protein